MRRFRFKLERLERVRRIQEEQERERWLAAEAVRRSAQAAEARARDAVHEAEDELRARQADDALGVAEVLRVQAAQERARVELRRARERTRTAAYQAERLRGPWEEKRKEVRGLERLEERERAAWRREELLREAKELDEVAGRRSADRPTDSEPFRPIGENTPALGARDPDPDPGGPGPAQDPSGTVRSTETSLPDRS